MKKGGETLVETSWLGLQIIWKLKEFCHCNLYGYPLNGGFPCRPLVKNLLAN